MRNLPKRWFPHKATLWKPSGSDAYGNPSYTSETVRVRWEDNQRTFVSNDGETKVSRAEVYIWSDPIGQYEPGYYIAKGEFADAEPVSQAFEIQNYSKIPSLYNKMEERRATI